MKSLMVIGTVVCFSAKGEWDAEIGVLAVPRRGCFVVWLRAAAFARP